MTLVYIGAFLLVWLIISIIAGIAIGEVFDWCGRDDYENFINR